MEKFIITYITSDDKSREIMIEAKNKFDAKRKAKQKLGRDCTRIITVY